MWDFGLVSSDIFGFMLPIVPVLGTLIGAARGRQTPGVGAPLGAVTGLAAGASGCVLASLFLVFLTWEGGIVGFLMVVFGLPLSGTLVPIIAVPLVGKWRLRDQRNSGV